jgi:hypothetical protein
VYFQLFPHPIVFVTHLWIHGMYALCMYVRKVLSKNSCDLWSIVLCVYLLNTTARPTLRVTPLARTAIHKEQYLRH